MTKENLYESEKQKTRFIFCSNNVNVLKKMNLTDNFEFRNKIDAKMIFSAMLTVTNKNKKVF